MNLAMVQALVFRIGSDGSAYAVDGPLREATRTRATSATFPACLACTYARKNYLRLEDAVRKMTS